jgi:hypothetical protein
VPLLKTADKTRQRKADHARPIPLKGGARPPRKTALSRTRKAPAAPHNQEVSLGEPGAHAGRPAAERKTGTHGKTATSPWYTMERLQEWQMENLESHEVLAAWDVLKSVGVSEDHPDVYKLGWIYRHASEYKAKHEAKEKLPATTRSDYLAIRRVLDRVKLATEAGKQLRESLVGDPHLSELGEGVRPEPRNNGRRGRPLNLPVASTIRIQTS